MQMAGLVLLEPSPQALVVAHFIGDGCHDDAYDYMAISIKLSKEDNSLGLCSSLLSRHTTRR